MEFSNEVNMEIKPFATVRQHTLGVTAIKFNPQNPNEFMTASHDEHVCIWDYSSRTAVQKVRLVNG